MIFTHDRLTLTLTECKFPLTATSCSTSFICVLGHRLMQPVCIVLWYSRVIANDIQGESSPFSFICVFYCSSLIALFYWAFPIESIFITRLFLPQEPRRFHNNFFFWYHRLYRIDNSPTRSYSLTFSFYQLHYKKQHTQSAIHLGYSEKARFFTVNLCSTPFKRLCHRSTLLSC